MHKYIEQVKEFNNRQQIQYNKALAEWKPEQGAMPYRGFHIYYDTNTGKDRTRGWVLSWESPQGGRGSILLPNKKEAEVILNNPNWKP